MGIFDFFKSKKHNENSDTSLSDERTAVSNESSSLDSKQKADVMDTNTLLGKLRDIAQDPTEYQISHGAMCYSPAFIQRKYKSCKCSICKRKIGEFEVDDYSDLVKQSGLIKKTGLAEVKIVCIDCLIKMCQSGDYIYEIKDWDIYDSLVRDYKSSTNKTALEIEGLALLEWYGEYQKGVRERKSSNDNEESDFWGKYIEPDYLVFLFKATDSTKTRLTVTSSYYLKYFLYFIQDKRTWKTWNDSTILLRDNIDIIERLTGLKL